MRNRLPLVINVLCAAIVIAVIARSMITTNKLKIAPEATVKLLSGDIVNLAQANQKSVLVFWATWCGPCSAELARLNFVAKNNPSFAQKIIAVSVGESPSLVRTTANERGYVFSVATDESSAAAQKYQITATPTVMLKGADNQIAWSTTGLSPTLEFRVLNHLK